MSERYLRRYVTLLQEDAKRMEILNREVELSKLTPPEPKVRECACGRKLGPLQTSDLCYRCQDQYRRVSDRERPKKERPAPKPKKKAPAKLKLVKPKVDQAVARSVRAALARLEARGIVVKGSVK